MNGIRAIFIGALSSHYHLWFIPMIIGLYICLPILNEIIKNEKIIKYFLVLSFICSFLIPEILSATMEFGSGTIKECATLINDRFNEMHIKLVCSYSFYFLTGYYINKIEIEKKCRKIIYALGILGFIVKMVMSIYKSRLYQIANDDFHSNFNIFVMITAIAVFVFFKYNVNEYKGTRKLIIVVSNSSFGAYLVHALIIESIERIFKINALSFNPVLSVIVIGMVTIVISFGISIGLNKIPFVNKYIV